MVWFCFLLVHCWNELDCTVIQQNLAIGDFSQCIKVKNHLGFKNSNSLDCLHESTLTHISLASFLWDIDKQCRPRSEATECGVLSGFP